MADLINLKKYSEIIKSHKKRFLESIKDYEEGDKLKIQKALDFAIEKHDGQLRKSGDPYVVHLIQVALKLQVKFRDVELTIAGLLHDIVEDCPGVGFSSLEEEFGRNIAFLVDSVTKNTDHYYFDKEKVFADKIDKLLSGILKDARCALLKIADREHNLETIGELKPNKQVRMSFETQAVFYPLKKILGFSLITNSIDEAKKSFEKFLKDKNVSSSDDLKKSLFNYSFKDLDDESFKWIYGNSDKIVWEINSLDRLRSICERDVNNNIIDIQSMYGDGEFFVALFKMNGSILINDNSKMDVFSLSI